jgi:hypothetical protein
MTRSTFCRGLAAVAALGAAAMFSSRASADVALGVDIDYAVPINVDAATSGYGFALRLGSPMHVALLVATPELGFTYHAFTGDAKPTAYRGIGGLRIAVGEIIRPGIFGHVGYGALKVDQGDTSSSFTYDFGAFLEFTLLPLLNIGVHGGYNQLTGGDRSSFQFATLGAQATLVF